MGITDIVIGFILIWAFWQPEKVGRWIRDVRGGMHEAPDKPPSSGSEA